MKNIFCSKAEFFISMTKKYLALHTTILILLISTTFFFVYKSFYTKNSTVEEKEIILIEENVPQKNEAEIIINNTQENKQNYNKIEIPETNTIPNEEAITDIGETSPTTTDETEEEKPPYSATLKVSAQSYEISFDKEGITLESLMKKLQSESDFRFSGVNYSSMGFFVNEINGIKNDNKQGKYWVYYLNGQSAQAGVSIQKINSGYNIEWKYEKSTF